MTMKKLSLLSFLLLSVLTLVGCAAAPSSQDDLDTAQTGAVSQYDANSWKALIPASCQSFNDGCNQCTRIEGSDDVACTRMFCETYAEPYCSDDENDGATQADQSDLEAMYVGLFVQDAVAQAEKNNTFFRVVMEDGEALPVTLDLRPGRINATVANGVVTAISIE